MTNLYKILPIATVKQAWFGVIVNKKIEDCRTNNSKTKVILKLPVTVQSVENVPNQWKPDFVANQPFMNEQEVLLELQNAEWQILLERT